jgi:hypothetical protein
LTESVVSFTAFGGSSTAEIVKVTVCVAEVSTPPFAVPPESWIRNPTVALPFRFDAGVQVRVPVVDTAGPAAKSAVFVFEATWNDSVWPLSLGPALIDVAQAGTLWAPLSSAPDWLAPATKLGTSLTAVIETDTVPTSVSEPSLTV